MKSCRWVWCTKLFTLTYIMPNWKYDEKLWKFKSEHNPVFIRLSVVQRSLLKVRKIWKTLKENYKNGVFCDWICWRTSSDIFTYQILWKCLINLAYKFIAKKMLCMLHNLHLTSSVVCKNCLKKILWTSQTLSNFYLSGNQHIILFGLRIPSVLCNLCSWVSNWTSHLPLFMIFF